MIIECKKDLCIALILGRKVFLLIKYTKLKCIEYNTLKFKGNSKACITGDPTKVCF